MKIILLLSLLIGFGSSTFARENAKEPRVFASISAKDKHGFTYQPVDDGNFDAGGLDIGLVHVIGPGFVWEGFTTFSMGTFSKTGSNDINLVPGAEDCSGRTDVAGECTFNVRLSPTAVGPTSAIFSIPWSGTYLDGGGNTQVLSGIGTYNISLTGTKKPPKDCRKRGSIIQVTTRVLGEFVPLVGTEHFLSYSSSYAPEYVSETSQFTQKYSFNKEGWTLSSHHFYDIDQKRLFLGTGTAESRQSVLQTDGTFLVISSGGDEVYIFDADGKHLFTKSFLKGSLIYSFQYSANNLVSVTDAFNNQTTLNRNGSGQLVSIQAPYGQLTTISIGSNGFIASVTNPNSESYTFTYKSGTGLLSSFTKPGGQTSTFTYDFQGHLMKDTGPDGSFTELFIDALQPGSPLIASSYMGRQSKFTGIGYSPSGVYSRSQTTPDGLTTQYAESPTGSTDWGNPIQRVVTTLTPDERFGSIHQRTNIITDKMGGVTSQTNFGQTVTFPPGVTDFFAFNTLTKTVSTSGRTTTQVFNAATNTLTTTTPEGATTQTILNAYEQPTSIKIGNDTARTFSYDARGRLSTTAQGSRGASSYSYNSAGYLQSLTDALSQVTSYVYDLSGRITKTILPDLNVVTYSYDPNGNMTSITPPGKPIHEFTFNLFDGLATYAPPALSGVSVKDTTYTYNMDRQLTNIARPDGRSVGFVYSASTGQLMSVGIGAGNYDYTYSATGQMDASYSPYNIRNNFTYYGTKLASDMQRTASSSTVIGRVGYTYDSDHRLSARTIRGNSATPTYTTNFVYNNDNQPTTIGAMTLTYEYPSGRVATTTVDRISDSRNYDAFGTLQSYTSTFTPASGPARTLYAYFLTRDLLGRITKKEETIRDTLVTYEYAYDSRGRLIEVKRNGAIDGSYVYDSNGNLTSSFTDGANYTFTYDDQDRLKTRNARTYTYDANGDIATASLSTGNRIYNFNELGYLTSFTSTGGNVYTYTYDGKNRLVRKLRNTTQSYRFIYDGSNIAAVVSGGDVQKEYVYGTNVNVPDYMNVYSGAPPGRYRLIKDHLGSPRLVVNTDTGEVLQSLDYNEWGRVLRDSNTCFQHFGFAGGIYDDDSRLVKFGARNYDPETGRWTTKDPIRFEGGDTNLYGYVLQDPINFNDSKGTGPVLGAVCAGLGSFFSGYNTTSTALAISQVQNKYKPILDNLYAKQKSLECPDPNLDLEIATQERNMLAEMRNVALDAFTPNMWQTGVETVVCLGALLTPL